MIRSFMKCHLGHPLTKLHVSRDVQVRYYPRGRNQHLPPSDLLNIEDGDALDEGEINSPLDFMEDQLYTETEDKELQAKAQRQWLKNKIIERKYFKKPQELNLLSWKAKEQIRYLHGEFPDEWNVAKLTQSFPVSHDAIIKVLKSTYRPMTQLEIDKHDKRVRKNWLALRSHLRERNSTTHQAEGGPIVQAAEQLVASSKLTLMINAGGFDNVSLPPRKLVTLERKEVGPFEAIVKDYVENEARMSTGKNFEQSHIEVKPLLEDLSTLGENLTSEHKSIISRNQRTPERDGSKCEQPAGSHISRRGQRLVQSLEKGTLRDVPLVDSHMEKLGMQETGLVQDSPQGRNSEWSNTEFDSHFERIDDSRTRLDKEKMTALKNIKLEKSKQGADYDVYMYDPKSGYQYPVGRQDEHMEKLNIPKSLQNRGDLYQNGKYVYDEDGEFLYKIP